MSEVGCRAGAECRFSHPDSGTPGEQTVEGPEVGHDAPVDASVDKKDALPVREKPRPVSRPVPQAQTQDPRAFQLGQVQRRFKPDITEQSEDSTLKFKMKPTDPDFPYEIDDLECILVVPKTFPRSGRPSLRVVNKDIPRGFQINIERGFDSVAAGAPDATLLGLMNRLDRQLEAILSGKMTETIKLIPNRGAAVERAKPEPPQDVRPVASEVTEPKEQGRVFTDDEKAVARQRRAAHTRQLEARFNRFPRFAKSTDGSTFTLPFDHPKKSSWPSSLRDLQTFRLHIADEYPLIPATLLLDSESPEARAVEKAYETQASKVKDATLTSQINYLLQHIAEMAAERTNASLAPSTVTASHPHDAAEKPIVEVPDGSVTAQPLDHDRPHIQVIPRPPEWDQRDGDSEHAESSSEYDTYDDSEHDVEHDEKEQPSAINSSTPAEKGVLLSFPHMELHGVELLEVVSLDITIKCERCKDTMDVHKLRNYSGEVSAMRDETCKKCARGLGVGFRADMIHAHSVRAGYLDLDGCQVVDMLPSTSRPRRRLRSRRLDFEHLQRMPPQDEYESHPVLETQRNERSLTATAFRIPEIKFLQVSVTSLRASRAPGPRKVKENLGITAGTELPRRGRCSHYSKSQRWFRFSCCSKVYPCDRCHDAAEDHPLEHANRMLCGFCSREQDYRPEDCGICHAVLIGKRGKGFWEGGKGTRDPKRMSRKDPRKYKRRPGTKAKD
nr:uncharacterized protein c18h10.09 [Quercus suber]